jgi:hypothetical protein
MIERERPDQSHKLLEAEAGGLRAVPAELVTPFTITPSKIG